MKEKIKKFIPAAYKIAVSLSVLFLYIFLFSDFFYVREPEPYVVSATFLTLVYLRKRMVI